MKSTIKFRKGYPTVPRFMYEKQKARNLSDDIKSFRTTTMVNLNNQQVQDDLKQILANLVALTTMDSSGLAKDSVKVLNKYIK